MEEFIRVFVYAIMILSGLFLAAVVIWTALTIFMYAKKKPSKTIVKEEKETIKYVTVPTEKTVIAETPAPVVYSGFWITRKEIADDFRNLKNKDISVVEHPLNQQIPTSLKWKTKTFALLYVSDDGPLMIVRITDELGKELAKINAEVRRAVFPKGNNWYSIPIAKTFEDKGAVYKVISAAQEFVVTKPAPAKKTAAKTTKEKADKTKTVKEKTTKEKVIKEKATKVKGETKTKKTIN